MLLSLERFANLLEVYLYKVYEVEMERGENYVSQIFTTGTSRNAKEPVTGIGVADLPRRWQGQVAYGDVTPMWGRDYTPVKYSSGLMMERELFDWSRWPEVKNRANSLLLAANRFRQQHAHAIFNGAFTGTVNVGDEVVNTRGPDGQSLCATNHPFSPEDVTIQSNRLSLPLTDENLENARLAMLDFKDNRGRQLLLMPDTLIVPPRLDKVAREIVYSEGRSDTADRVDNVRKNAYTVLMLPLLEDPTAWFLVDSRSMKKYCLWLDWRKAVPEREADFDTEVLKFKLVSIFGYGFHHWSFCVGSRPA